MNYLTLNEYRQMVSDIIETKDVTGEFPDYAQIKEYKIPKRSYSHMIERVNKFILEQGRSPCSVRVK